MDWLCSDENKLNEYMNDTLCKESISSGLFYQLLNSMKTTAKSYDNWQKDIPILLVSGNEDPVGDFKKGVYSVEKEMKKHIKNVTLNLYKGRHDILHEEKNQTAEHVRSIIGEFVLNYL